MFAPRPNNKAIQSVELRVAGHRKGHITTRTAETHAAQSRFLKLSNNHCNHISYQEVPSTLVEYCSGRLLGRGRVSNVDRGYLGPRLYLTPESKNTVFPLSELALRTTQQQV
ncbi:hypothetical protein AG1IA_09292 [Rhizoctonia solani AG-1 IA]|uniref:Uncharacterized protein n=1 Tax=Thanatephorus cucumeris (strain AG1-IA) TaxID=983506 RepID=L8WER6_THACA|nr:hypothetical protein AG1IA_09292 [Rhizoctonia solani AG-1 IA]